MSAEHQRQSDIVRVRIQEENGTFEVVELDRRFVEAVQQLRAIQRGNTAAILSDDFSVIDEEEQET